MEAAKEAVNEATKDYTYIGPYMSAAAIRNAHGLYVCSISSYTKHVENAAARSE